MKEIHVLNLGAGTQSTMVALMPAVVPDRVPQFTAAIFADTGEESAPTYSHLRWIQANVAFPVLVRSRGRLGDDLMLLGVETSDSARIPAFLAANEGVQQGMMRRSCTFHYKIQVINQTIRRELLGLERYKHVGKDVRVHTYTGLSYEEGSRIAKVNARALPWQTFHHPLHELHITRPMAKEWLRDRVPHAVPRSACVFCPYRRDDEWIELKRTDPVGFARAVEVDSALRSGARCVGGMRKAAYLHPSCRPLDQVEFIEDDQPVFSFAQECHGMCGL